MFHPFIPKQVITDITLATASLRLLILAWLGTLQKIDTLRVVSHKFTSFWGNMIYISNVYFSETYNNSLVFIQGKCVHDPVIS